MDLSETQEQSNSVCGGKGDKDDRGKKTHLKRAGRGGGKKRERGKERMNR